MKYLKISVFPLTADNNNPSRNGTPICRWCLKSTLTLSRSPFLTAVTSGDLLSGNALETYRFIGRSFLDTHRSVACEQQTQSLSDLSSLLSLRNNTEALPLPFILSRISLSKTASLASKASNICLIRL